MPTITEGGLVFSFGDTWVAEKYDGWRFQRKQFQNVCGGAKAVDIIAIEPNQCVWLIEVKDYRSFPRTKAIELADEVAAKVRDSLAGLVAAQCNANDLQEKQFARRAMQECRLRVVLHLEQPRTYSRLFPRAIDPAAVRQRLKQLVKAIDPHPTVVDRATMQSVNWTVS